MLSSFPRRIDQFLNDMRSQGRINSPSSERAYRDTLYVHADDTDLAPALTTREDVKRTLRRWAHPNSQRTKRSHLVSFYQWMMEEGLRHDNPARQTRRPKKRPVNVYRMTAQEARRMLAATVTMRERWAVHLGICAGLRNAELRGLRGQHFARDGFVWVSPDIAKGQKERYVPIVVDLLPVVAEIRERVQIDQYVLPAQRWLDPSRNLERIDLALVQSSSQALRTLVMEVAKRAGIAAHIHPHLMRHAFADHLARYAGERNAQAALGHANLGTTESYLAPVPLAHLAEAFAGFSFYA